MVGHRDLMKIEDAEDLPIDRIWDLYRSHVSGSLVELIGAFGFGRARVRSAAGCYIYLEDGRKILDATGGIGVLNHGHNHPEILAARTEFASRRRMEVHKNFFSPYIAALGLNMSQLLPGDLSISFFPSSGSEAVEGAIKLAYKYHEGARSTILRADISFHGKLLGAASVTGSPELHFRFPQIPGVDSFEYGNAESLGAALSRNRKDCGESDVYAVILEPLSASSMLMFSTESLLEARRLCDESGAVLIFDEVYTGWGKTGHLFNFMRAPGLVPDIVTYAKSFGGGKSSIAGYTTREHIARKAYDNLQDATLHSTTYLGLGEEAATALKAIEIIVRDSYVEKAHAIGQNLGRNLRNIASRNRLVTSVQGSGALWGVFLDSFLAELAAEIVGRLPRFRAGAKSNELGKKLLTGAVVSHLFNKHNVLTYFGSNRGTPLIVSLPIIADDEEINAVCGAIDETLQRGPAALARDFVAMKLSGPKS